MKKIYLLGLLFISAVTFGQKGLYDVEHIKVIMGEDVVYDEPIDNGMQLLYAPTRDTIAISNEKGSVFTILDKEFHQTTDDGHVLNGMLHTCVDEDSDFVEVVLYWFSDAKVKVMDKFDVAFAIVYGDTAIFYLCNLNSLIDKDGKLQGKKYQTSVNP